MAYKGSTRPPRRLFNRSSAERNLRSHAEAVFGWKVPDQAWGQFLRTFGAINDSDSAEEARGSIEDVFGVARAAIGGNPEQRPTGAGERGPYHKPRVERIYITELVGMARHAARVSGFRGDFWGTCALAVKGETGKRRTASAIRKRCQRARARSDDDRVREEFRQAAAEELRIGYSRGESDDSWFRRVLERGLELDSGGFLTHFSGTTRQFSTGGRTRYVQE